MASGSSSLPSSLNPLAASFGFGKKKDKNSEDKQTHKSTIPVEKVGTIYFNATAYGSYGFPDPKLASEWCISVIEKDLLSKSDEHSVLSGASNVSRAEAFGMPTAAVKLTQQFLDLMKTEDLGSPGFIRYVVQEQDCLKFMYHWSRAYFRSPKSITHGGKTEFRTLLSSGRYTTELGLYYELKISIVCT